MENITNRPETTNQAASSRRSFLRVAGAAAVTGGLLTACSHEDLKQVSPSGARVSGTTIALPAGDLGILTYAYVLEQLEAAFYDMIVSKPYNNMSSGEMQIFQDIRGHEIIHREFFKTALGNNAIPALTFNFSAINFSLRPSVLGAASDFESTGVGAYNGAGKYIASADYLTLAGKIVSVETRHSSIIRELQFPNTAAFAAEPLVSSADGLHLAYEPAKVLPIAQSFIMETIDASALVASLTA